MWSVLSVLSLKSSKGLKKKDDDWTDRLSSRYTVVLLLAFAIFVTMTHIVRNPITCWCPAHFQGGWIKYVNNLCWVNNTYFLDYNEEVPRGEPHPDKFIRYYQWIPFILLGQAIFFYFPSIVWHSLNQKAGVDSDDILESAITINSFSAAEESRRKVLINVITGQLKRCIESYERSKQLAEESGNRFKRIIDMLTGEFGGYLFGVYLFSKLCYIANAFLQLYLLRVFFPNYHFFGIDYFMEYTTDYYDTNTVFPRYTMCNFLVRMLGNVQRYSVQCVLPINMVVEKIYLFMWYWTLMVAILSVLSLIMWILKLISRPTANSFLMNHVWRGNFKGKNKKKLQRMESYNTELKLLVSQIEPFRRILGVDGYFMLQLIAHNTNVVSTTEIVSALYQDWRDNDEPITFTAARRPRKPVGNGDSLTKPLTERSAL